MTRKYSDELKKDLALKDMYVEVSYLPMSLLSAPERLGNNVKEGSNIIVELYDHDGRCYTHDIHWTHGIAWSYRRVLGYAAVHELTRWRIIRDGVVLIVPKNFYKDSEMSIS